jgi:hypothetical protein
LEDAIYWKALGCPWGDCELTEDEGMTAITRRMEREFALRSGDGLLGMLAGLGRSGLPIGVGMIVDGIVLRGGVTGSSVFAEALDSALSRIVDVIGTSWDSEVRNTIEGAFGRKIEQRDRNEGIAREVAERYFEHSDSEEGPNIDDIDVTDVVKVYSAVNTPSVIELTEAKLLIAGVWVEVKALRVELDHIGAWWPLDAEAGANVTYIDQGQA